MKIETVLAQSGLLREEHTGSISTPIYQNATFRHPGLGQSTGYDYTRTSNPTRKALEDSLALLEGGTGGFAFASGMAAITAVVSMFKSGDHFIISDDLYGGTYRLFESIFSAFGVSTTYVDTSYTENILRAITQNTKALFIETPTNPVMKITDIAKVSSAAAEYNILTVVDNTFMTPYNQRPLELGADIVVHSGTKYLAGHNDVLCGFIAAKDRPICERIGYIQNATGGVLSPFDSWLVIRGMKTLAVRMDRAEKNAADVVSWLSKQKNITRIYYPGLKEHPGHIVHSAQSKGFGSMVSFCAGSREMAEKIINSVKIISFAESLGGVESLITYPCIQTHGDIPADVRNRLGITDDLLRLSVGIENVDDIISDLENAFAR